MAEYVELFIDQGTDFTTVINMNDDNTNMPQNVSGYIVTSQIRKSLLSANTAARFDCYVSDAANGEITVSIDAANTANLTRPSYFYDIKVVAPGGSTSRLIEGVLFITPSITK